MCSTSLFDDATVCIIRSELNVVNFSVTKLAWQYQDFEE